MPKAARKTTTHRRPSPNIEAARLGEKAPAMRSALRTWYLANQRALPWRTAPTLYKTVVSEFMLQQTQVATVLPYFERWLKQFQDFAALAAASEATVLRAWEGLGYYRRARLLHALARELAKFPAPPRAVDDWLALPGIGPYTAAAITSITYSTPAAVVDGNVVRVLARVLGDFTEFRDGSAAVKAMTPAAQTLIDPAHPGDHNQAIMELGATVCTRRAPLCTICPWVTWCVAAALGEQEALPKLMAKKIAQVSLRRLWIERKGALLLHRKAADSRQLAGMCELPDATLLPAAKIDPKPLTIKRRTITNQSFTESIHRAALRASTPDPTLDESSGLIWATPRQLARLTLSGPHRRWIEELRKDSKTSHH